MAIKYQTTTYRTCTGENDGSGLLVELSLAQTHKLSGTLKEITIPVRSSGLEGSIIPTYLSIHLEQFDGTWLQVAVSNNAVTPVAGGTSVWSFDGIILNGRRIRLIPVATKDAEQQSGLHLHYKFIVSSDGSQIKYGHAWYGQLPDITFTIENTLFVPDEKPEQDVEVREIDIRNYMPLVVRDTDEFQQIAAAENPEFNELQACIYRVLQDSFVQYATEYGVARWESILGLTPAVGATLDERKAAILTYLSVKLPYTWRVLKQMLVGVLGEDKFVMDYINDEGKLVLHTDRLDHAKLAAVNDLLARVLPQNIEVVQYNHHIEVSWKNANKYAECKTLQDILNVEPVLTETMDPYGLKNGSIITHDLTPSGDFGYPLPNMISVAPIHHVNGGFFKYVSVDTFRISLPKCTRCYAFMRNNSYVKHVEVDAPLCTNYERAFKSTKLQTVKFTGAVVNADLICMNSPNLYSIKGDFSKATRLTGAFAYCKLDKESALMILNSIKTWDDGQVHNLTLGIHIDHQNDEEVLAAIDAATAKGWTVSLQWNGEPTSGVTTTDLDEIWCKVTESEYGDYTDENGTPCSLEWCHMVTSPDGKSPSELGYKLFFSLVEAEQYFKLTKIEVTEND